MIQADLKSVELIGQFLRFDTTSDQSNLPLISFARDHLEKYGFTTETLYNADGTKANLLASIGPVDTPGIVLSGHTDTVPVDGQDWSVDPFELTQTNGRLLGRGICDMKGFLAIALSFVPELSRAKLKKPLYFALSYDEEVGCLGVHSLTERLQALTATPMGCIVGEPSGMDVVTAHKGTTGFEITVSGLEAHTGVAHLGANAVTAAAKIVAYISQIQERLKFTGPFNRDFLAPNYTVLEATTISGGTAINIVPASCSFEVDVRYLPGDDPRAYMQECKQFAQQNLLPKLRTIAPEAAIAWKEVPGCAAFSSDPHSDVVKLVQSCAQKNSTHSVGWGTEAGHFQEAGIPTVVCGPGSIEQAHKPDEFITIEQARQCEQFMGRLISFLSY